MYSASPSTKITLSLRINSRTLLFGAFKKNFDVAGGNIFKFTALPFEDWDNIETYVNPSLVVIRLLWVVTKICLSCELAILSISKEVFV